MARVMVQGDFLNEAERFAFKFEAVIGSRREWWGLGAKARALSAILHDAVAQREARRRAALNEIMQLELSLKDMTLAQRERIEHLKELLGVMSLLLFVAGLAAVFVQSMLPEDDEILVARRGRTSTVRVVRTGRSEDVG